MVSGFSTHFQGFLMVSGVRLPLGAESIYGLRIFKRVSKMKFIVTNIIAILVVKFVTIYGHKLAALFKIIVTHVEIIGLPRSAHNGNQFSLLLWFTK
jgi:hypothetical protein